MFASYCASCHGEDGKGAGPAAAALKITPVDLTMLSKKNGGKFPDRHTIAVLEFGEQTAAHGSAAMPVWGPALGKLNPSNSSDRPMRISNLIRYLESIQAK
jgi:mono/diheme cytochrome c family protein